MKARGDGKFLVLTDDDGEILTKIKMKSVEHVQAKLTDLGYEESVPNHPWVNLLVETNWHLNYVDEGIDPDDTYLVVNHDNFWYESISDIQSWLDHNVTANTVPDIAIYDRNCRKHVFKLEYKVVMVLVDNPTT